MNRKKINIFPKKIIWDHEGLSLNVEMVYVKKIFLVPPLESLIFHRILTFCGFFRSKQNGSSKWEQRQEEKRTVPMASTRAASILQKSQGFKDRKPGLEPLFYHFLTVRPWPNHNFPRRHFLFMKWRVMLLWELTHTKHMEVFIQMSNILSLLWDYTHHDLQSEIKTLPTGVLPLEIALGLVPEASTADSERI